MIVTAYIENFGKAGFISWIDSDKFKGLVVQGKSLDEVKVKLYKSIRVKIAYDYGLDISTIEARELTANDIPIVKATETETEFQLELMV